MSVDGGGAFLDQLFGGLFSLKGDKGKVLWFIVLALVHRPYNLGNRAKCNKVSLNLLIGDALGGEVAEVDLALLGLGLLAGDLLSLDDMSLLTGGGLYPGAVLEQDEGETSGSSGVRVCLQVDVLDFSKLTEILLDVCVFGLLVKEKRVSILLYFFHCRNVYLWKPANEELPVIFVNWIGFSCHC